MNMEPFLNIWHEIMPEHQLLLLLLEVLVAQEVHLAEELQPHRMPLA